MSPLTPSTELLIAQVSGWLLWFGGIGFAVIWAWTSDNRFGYVALALLVAGAITGSYERTLADRVWGDSEAVEEAADG